MIKALVLIFAVLLVVSANKAHSSRKNYNNYNNNNYNNDDSFTMSNNNNNNNDNDNDNGYGYGNSNDQGLLDAKLSICDYSTGSGSPLVCGGINSCVRVRNGTCGLQTNGRSFFVYNAPNNQAVINYYFQSYCIGAFVTQTVTKKTCTASATGAGYIQVFGAWGF